MISRGFSGGEGVQLGPKGSSTQHQIRGDTRNSSRIQTASVGYYHNLSDSDMEGYQHHHDDPLVIRVVVANKIVHRVLVDNGSSADIIFASAFDKIGIGREKLELVNAHLRGFSVERVLPLGQYN